MVMPMKPKWKKLPSGGLISPEGERLLESPGFLEALAKNLSAHAKAVGELSPRAARTVERDLHTLAVGAAGGDLKELKPKKPKKG